MILGITPTAERDIAKHKKSGDKILIRKIATLLEELKDHPEIGTGNPERLKGNLTGYWSRHINKKHHLIYKIKDDIVTVYVISAYGHYGNK